MDLKNVKVFLSNQDRVTLNQIKEDELIIDTSFISLLIENGLTEFDIKQIFNSQISSNYSDNFFKKPQDQTNILKNTNPSNSSGSWLDKFEQNKYSPTKSSVKRWRSAEEKTLEVLNRNGFVLEDVSKQNIGYDLEGIDPDGNEIQIEVKSITLPGQKFKLTNNEVAVSQEKQNSYFVAIVRQLDSFIEIGLIPNPVENLILDRQCVQWIWECSNYKYEPIKFEI